MAQIVIAINACAFGFQERFRELGDNKAWTVGSKRRFIKTGFRGRAGKRVDQSRIRGKLEELQSEEGKYK